MHCGYICSRAAAYRPAIISINEYLKQYKERTFVSYRTSTHERKMYHFLRRLLTLLIFFGATSTLTINNGIPLSTPENTNKPTISLPSNLNTNNSLTMDFTPRCYHMTTPDMHILVPSDCDKLAKAMCIGIGMTQPDKFVRDKWFWTELGDGLEGCAAGYFIPSGAYPPSRSSCSVIVEEGIISMCIRTSEFNAGSNNVLILPNFVEDGMAIDRRYPMFIISPWKLSD